MIEVEQRSRRRDAAIDQVAAEKARRLGWTGDCERARALLGPYATDAEVETLVRAMRYPDAVLGGLRGAITKRRRRTQHLNGFQPVVLAGVTANVQETKNPQPSTATGSKGESHGSITRPSTESR